MIDIISGAREGTIVDGVNLDEIREFAKQFKIRRLSLGLTQTQVGQALSATEGPSYSQSAICRLVRLPSSLCPVLQLVIGPTVTQNSPFLPYSGSSWSDVRSIGLVGLTEILHTRSSGSNLEQVAKKLTYCVLKDTEVEISIAPHRKKLTSEAIRHGSHSFHTANTPCLPLPRY